MHIRKQQRATAEAGQVLFAGLVGFDVRTLFVISLVKVILQQQ